MNTTSTPALGAYMASLAITNPAVIAGTASLPVYAATATGSVAGAFLTQTGNFVGTWVLSRQTAGIQGGQTVAGGDQNFLALQGANPFLNLTGLSALTLTVDASAGSMTLTVVQ